jgi:hypothetical protein
MRISFYIQVTAKVNLRKAVSGTVIFKMFTGKFEPK